MLPSRLSLAAFRAFCFVAVFAALHHRAHAQGCVAIKQMGDGASPCSAFDAHTDDKWSFTANYEHFRSHRHFVGSEEQHQRYDNGSEVINVVEQFDFSLSYRLDLRNSITVGLPYFSAARSSLYEHDRVNRYTMYSRGIGDLHATFDRWMFDPASHPTFNLSLGLGIKAPTGKSNVKDYAHTTTGLVWRNVDQSIQPGDGAWGYIVELQAYYQLAPQTSLYASGFYLINPAETNGTRNGNNPASVTGYMSVADQYQARLGVAQQFPGKYNFSASLGGRLEGVPALDLIGGNRGFRRPGYVISVEPGLSFGTAHDTVTVSVPWVVYRNRIRSYADKLSGGHGDAAFADFLISLTYSRRW